MATISVSVETPSPPGSPASTTSYASRNDVYLRVPGKAPPKTTPNKASGTVKKKKPQTRALSSNYLAPPSGPSQLGSLLSLYGSDSSDESDSDSSVGTPPPNRRPPAFQDILEGEFEDPEMYGRYTANLAEYARQEAKRLREDERNKDELLFSKELQPYRGRIARTTIKLIRPVWDNTFARLGEDWVFLFILGLCMATISFVTDYIVLICFQARMYLHQDLLFNIHWSLQLFAWVTIPTLLVIFSAAFCQWLAPSAIGSGIPEMKTILRGVILKEYLSWKTLIAKIVGLATVIGAGLPLGKEGPVMHMASILSTMLMNALSFLKGVADNEAHTTDLLAAAATMGVAVCYAAPIGGVLFSIEVTAVYFAVRNYWRGFFASVVGAMFYRLMSVWIMKEETIYPIYKVVHNFEFPYDVVELLPFMCIGIVSGFAGSLFVYLHRRYVLFIRQNKTIKTILNKKRLLYPTLVAIFISGTTFPLALGQFVAATVFPKQQLLDLFSNVTWTVLPDEVMTLQQERVLQDWGLATYNRFHICLFLYQIVSVFDIAIASTLPVPNGILIPLVKVGAAFGRQIGELMVFLYPHGIRHGYPIVPGAYAMVGAASFAAGITHTISISVIIFELTGQITYVIPIMIGVLISNCISSLLQPSIYDSVIRIKKLPYLPDIVSATSDVYNIYVEDIMVREVKYIWYGMTYMDLKRIIKENRKLKFFPIVDKHDSMILLGSVPRIELVRLLVEQISSSKRKTEAKQRHLEALKKRWELEDSANQNDRIHYEDELNSSDEEEETGNRLMRSLSKSLSRSLSRSRSISRSLSRLNPASRHQSPERTEDELPKDSNLPSASDASDHFGVSDAVTKLKQLFPPPKIFVERSDSDNGKEDVLEISEGASAEDPPPHTDEVDDTSETKKSSSDFMEKSPKTKTKPKLRLMRSNSLDSLRSPSPSKDVSDGVTSRTDSVLENATPKGILKRRNSLSLGSLSVPSRQILETPEEANYQTVTVVDTKLRNAIEKVKRMRMDTATSMELKLSQLSLFKTKKKNNAKKKEFDLPPEEREEWELQELSKEVDYAKCHIDPSPFQLVERTSLLRVHSLFSMLGINHAYVTAIGRLVGVMALKEVREAIEGQYLGKASSQKANPGGVPGPRRSSISASVSPDDPETGSVIKRTPSANHLSPCSNGLPNS